MNWKNIWNRFDKLCYVLGNWIIFIVIVIILFSLAYKQMAGETMFFQDYYEQHK